MAKIRNTVKLIPLAPVRPVLTKKSNGAITVVLTREHIFGSRKFL